MRPCAAHGLTLTDSEPYPRLAAWYDALEERVPAYCCRVRGDADSWAKVLSQAGFGNGGAVPELDPSSASAFDDDLERRGDAIWADYADARPYVAASAAAEAASVVVRNRAAILADADRFGVQDAEPGLLAVAAALFDGAPLDDGDAAAKGVATYLDDRLCVPRDLGAPSAAALRKLLL